MPQRYLRTRYPFAARAYSASGTQKIFEDSPLRVCVVDTTDGFVLYNDRDTLGDAVKDLTKVESESIYAETYAELFNLALHNNEALFETFGDTTLDGDGDDRPIMRARSTVWSAAAAAGCTASSRRSRAC